MARAPGWVQDAAAALPAKLFGDVRGRSVADLCAAPGGKTAQLAAAGARVIAVDRAPGRLERLQQNLARLHLAAETVAADVMQWRPEPFDAVLLDAPARRQGRSADIPTSPGSNTRPTSLRSQRCNAGSWLRRAS